MRVKVKVYDESKYQPNSKKIAETEYDICKFEVVDGELAKEIESMTDEDGKDEYGEYLVLTLKNGETATFRNSHVDLFRV